MSTSWTSMCYAGLASFFVAFQHWHLKCDPPGDRWKSVAYVYSWLCTILLIGLIVYLGYAVGISAVIWISFACAAVTLIGFFLFEGPLGRFVLGKPSFVAAPLFTYFLLNSISRLAG